MTTHQPVIETRDLAKTFAIGFRRRKVEAIRGVSFSAMPQEIFGFLGPNGAGKTTTIKIIVGLLRPTRGKCFLLGEEAGNIEARRRIGYLPEAPYFYDHLLPEEFMDLCGRLRGLPGKVRRKRGMELLEKVGLARALDRPLRKFSKGMLQRIGLAQSLIGDPDLLILDEPMTGLDPVGRKEVRDLILELRRQGKTIFFSSHILSDVETICDRVAIVNEGRVVDEGSLVDLLHRKELLVDIEIEDATDELRERLKDHILESTEDGDILRVVVQSDDSVNSVVKDVLEGGARIHSVIPRRETLEALFMKRALRSN